MDAALKTKDWMLTNGIITMSVCTVCAQPYREGHIDCTCPSNHAERCERPTYDQLKAQHDALVAALGIAYEALSGMGEQTEAASAAAYDAVAAAAYLEQVK